MNLFKKFIKGAIVIVIAYLLILLIDKIFHTHLGYLMRSLIRYIVHFAVYNMHHLRF